MRHEKVIINKSYFQATIEKLDDSGTDGQEIKEDLVRNAEEVVMRCNPFCVEVVRNYTDESG